ERTAAPVMGRAGQTPHGARPNREEVPPETVGHVPARCVKPPGRSLEPGSDARPRGMAVLRQHCRGQNSAYRSGCHKPFSRTSSFILWIEFGSLGLDLYNR